MASSQPPQAGPSAPGSSPAPSGSSSVLLALKQIDPAKDLANLPSMPCARQSLLLGIGGGVGVGAIRFLSSRRPLSSSNWAVATFSVLALTSWEVCRRAHAKEKSKMQAVVADYKRKISQNKVPGTDGAPEQAGAPTRGPPIGGVLMGQKGQEMLKERQEQNATGSSGAPPGRLV